MEALKQFIEDNMILIGDTELMTYEGLSDLSIFNLSVLEALARQTKNRLIRKEEPTK